MMKHSHSCSPKTSRKVSPTKTKDKHQAEVGLSQDRDSKVRTTQHLRAWDSRIISFRRRHQFNSASATTISKVDSHRKAIRRVAHQKRGHSTTKDSCHMSFRRRWKPKWARLFNSGPDFSLSLVWLLHVLFCHILRLGLRENLCTASRTWFLYGQFLLMNIFVKTPKEETFS